MQDLMAERDACMINIIERGPCGDRCLKEVYVYARTVEEGVCDSR
jgi:hypothetical protein